MYISILNERIKAFSTLLSIMLMVNVCDTELSFGDGALAPSSESTDVTVAIPFALALGVKVRSPLESIEGATAKSPGLSFVRLKLKVCEFSSLPPPLVVVANPGIVTEPTSSLRSATNWSVCVGSSFIGFTVIVFVTSPVLKGVVVPVDVVLAVFPTTPVV